MRGTEGPGALPDAILLENVQVPAALGVTAGERALRRSVRVDLEIGRSLAEPGRSDRVEETIDYGEIFKVVESVAGGAEHNLVEALGERIAEALLTRFEIEWVQITVRKARPMAGSVESAGVRMTRFAKA
ncbi:MAG: dihydroneopterin aldolase [Myxococcota bacterium]|nr:dihydroneopterin aldolase [Myxococcota bacterium]